MYSSQDTVEFRRGRLWIRGIVDEVRADGSLNIKADDGEYERRVPSDSVRAVTAVKRSSAALAATSDSKSDVEDSKVSSIIKGALKGKPTASLSAKLSSAFEAVDFSDSGCATLSCSVIFAVIVIVLCYFSKVDEETFYEALQELRWGLTRSDMSALFHRFEGGGKVTWSKFIEHCMREVTPSTLTSDSDMAAPLKLRASIMQLFRRKTSAGTHDSRLLSACCSYCCYALYS
jgi:hypothetical protein